MCVDLQEWLDNSMIQTPTPVHLHIGLCEPNEVMKVYMVGKTMYENMDNVTLAPQHVPKYNSVLPRELFLTHTHTKRFCYWRAGVQPGMLLMDEISHRPHIFIFRYLFAE